MKYENKNKIVENPEWVGIIIGMLTFWNFAVYTKNTLEKENY